MKVLQLCNRIPHPLIDGGAIAMFAMTKGFVDQGCEVHMLAINTKKHRVLANAMPDFYKKKIQFYSIEADTDVKPFDAFKNLFTNESYNLIRFDIPAFHQKLKQLLLANTYDVVQLEGFFLSMYIPTIRENSKAFVSMRAHNVEFLIWERMAKHTKNLFKQWYLKLLAKRLKEAELASLKLVDSIIPISKVDESMFLSFGLSKPMLICTAGVEEEILHISNEFVDEKSLFHLAAMNWQPNLEAAQWLLQKVWPLLKKAHPDCKLYLAGKDMPSEFFRLADEGLVVSGKIPDAHAFMADKNIMLVPLLSGSGMRIKIIEGLALGKLIVTTSIGAEGIDCTHKKNIFIADSAQAFVEAVETALNDKQLSAEIRLNAKQLIREQYTNTVIVKRLVDFYQSQIA